MSLLKVLKENIQTLFHRSFVFTSDEETAIRTFPSTGFALNEYDYIAVTYPDTVTELYTYKTGGSGGTTVDTITVVYTDTTKEDLLSVTKA